MAMCSRLPFCFDWIVQILTQEHFVFLLLLFILSYHLPHELRVEYELVYHSLWFPVMKCASMLVMNQEQFRLFACS